MSKQQFITDYKSIKDTLKTYDGTEGKDQADAIQKEAELLAEAITNYVERILSGKQCVITPAAVATAALANGGGPVAAANNLTGSIEDKLV